MASLSRSQIFLILWISWLFVGTMFYAYADQMNLGFAKGFYMAVNIGYSIGFGYPTEPFINYHWFSSFYVISGASFVAGALGFFADKVGEDFGAWFEQQRQRQRYQTALKEGKSLWKEFKYWCIENQEHIRAVGIWILWIFIMILYSMINIGWSFTQAWYFAISTCSTGGHWAIPSDSSDWMFAITGFFAAIGVPLMGVAMATIARAFIDFGDLEDTKNTIREAVTKAELEMLQELGLENGDGVIDKSEYIILCMVRTGTDPELIKFISDRFNELDLDHGGSLSVREITEGIFMMGKDGKIVDSDRGGSSLLKAATAAIGTASSEEEVSEEDISSPPSIATEAAAAKTLFQDASTNDYGEKGSSDNV